MREFKVPHEDFAKLSTPSRLSKLRWWFLLLLLLGVLALLYVIYSQITTIEAERVSQSGHRVNASSIASVFVPSAHAAPLLQPGDDQEEPFDPRPYIMLGIFAVLGVVLLSAVYTTLRSSDPDKVETAGDIVKTLLGFFIGVATSYIGLPPA